MAQKKKLPTHLRPLVIATVHSKAGLAAARNLSPRAVDLLEIRLDCLADSLSLVESALPGLSFPLLFTARHASEGGRGRLAARERGRLLAHFLPHAAAIDVELRSVHALAGVMEEAARQGVARVVSVHYFRRTPSAAALQSKLRAARQAGAEIVKVATTLRGPRDLATLLELAARAPGPVALMGMGPLGRVSRLALAAAGSRLNYGYLDRPQVPGQWPAERLMELIKEVGR
jgi:3-dehydroquinate dehydratase-1